MGNHCYLTHSRQHSDCSLEATVWGHFVFGVAYNDEGTKTLDRKVIVSQHCSPRVATLWKHLKDEHTSPSPQPPSNIAVWKQESRAGNAVSEAAVSASCLQTNLSYHTRKTQKNTSAVGTFIVKDLLPFFSGDGSGFSSPNGSNWSILHWAPYTFISYMSYSELYENTRKTIEDELDKAQSLAITKDSWNELNDYTGIDW